MYGKHLSFAFNGKTKWFPSLMIATGKIDGIFYNANDKKIYHWHSFSGIRFGEHV